MPEGIRYILKEFPWRHIALFISGVPLGSVACYLAGRVVIYQISLIVLILMAGIIFAASRADECRPTTLHPRPEMAEITLSQLLFNLTVGCFFGFGLTIVYIF